MAYLPTGPVQPGEVRLLARLRQTNHPHSESAKTKGPMAVTLLGRIAFSYCEGDEMTAVAGKRETYAARWSEVYAPIRRSISGTWKRANDGPVFELSFDSYGRYRLREFVTEYYENYLLPLPLLHFRRNRGGEIEGKYAVVQHDGDYFIALDKHMGDISLRIDDLQEHSLRLAPEGDPQFTMSLLRRSAA